MKLPKLKAIVCLFVLISLVPMSSLAFERSGKGARGNGPPPEAIAACEGKETGDEVEFTGRRGETVSATCEERDGQLVAVPEKMRKR